MEQQPAPLRVLVVEDHPGIRSVLVRAMKEHPAFAFAGEAADGVEAVGVAERTAPAGVSLDLSMPRRDGREALPLLRALLPGAAIVVFSSEPPEAAEDVLDLGADAFVPKQAGLDALLDALLVARRDATGPRSLSEVGGAGEPSGGAAPSA